MSKPDPTSTAHDSSSVHSRNDTDHAVNPTMVGEATIEALVVRLRAGDALAAEKLWEAYGPQLRRRARTRLRQYGIYRHTESMDICNAVLLDLVKQGQVDLRRSDDVICYFMRAVDNQVRDAFKLLTRECRDMRRMDHRPVDELPLNCALDSPSHQLIRSEVLGQIREQLGPDAAMVDWVLASENWGQIGERMGLAPDAARMRWKRALQRLQERMGMEPDDE
ncbi:MAG: hypothetical protein KDB14_10580 [Planctomycetales bacterium]|nr:hypothetical protein [Planctomycetales bacterium]